MNDVEFYQTSYDGLTDTWSVYSVTESSSAVLEQTPQHSAQSIPLLEQIHCIFMTFRFRKII